MLPHPTLHSLLDAQENFEAISKAPDWRPASFAAGWTSFDAALYPVSYAISADGRVQLRGHVRKTTADITSNETVLTLPAGARPRYGMRFTAAAGASTLVELTVGPTGEVKIQSGLSLAGTRGTFVGIDGVSFWAEV